MLELRAASIIQEAASLAGGAKEVVVVSRDKKQLAATARPWRVVIDNSGNPITGGYPSICPVDESLDRMIIHWDGFHHEFWDTHPSRPVQVANAKLIVTAVNERDALLSEVARLREALETLRHHLQKQSDVVGLIDAALAGKNR